MVSLNVSPVHSFFMLFCASLTSRFLYAPLLSTQASQKALAKINLDATFGAVRTLREIECLQLMRWHREMRYAEWRINLTSPKDAPLHWLHRLHPLVPYPKLPY